MNTPVPSPVPRPHPATLSKLSVDMRAAGFTEEGLRAHLGDMAYDALVRDQCAAARWVVNTSTEPWVTALRLFAWGETVPRQHADALFRTVGVPALLECGLVCDDAAGLRASCRVQPYGDGINTWWLASDHSEEALGTALPPWHVLGVGGASSTLASWTPRRAVARALDLGTGCGVQAVHLGTHCDDVVATDISARALAFAQFNAAWAEQNWTCAQGSLYQPVQGQRFDLVVSNPPFVITPRTGLVPHFEYRDGGQRGDSIVRDVLLGMESMLEPGGLGIFLANWEVAAKEKWDAPVRQWLEHTALDAWVIVRDSQNPAEYAALWARDGGHHERTDAYVHMVGEWLQEFDSRSVVSIEFAVIVVQRPRTARVPFRDVVRVHSAVASPLGPTIDQGMRARTWLAEHPQAWWDEVWVCADDVTEERHFRPGEPDPRVLVVRQGGGLRRTWVVSTHVVAVLGVCDGDLTPAQAAAAVAVLGGKDVAEVRAELEPVLREFITDAVVLPVRGWDALDS